MTTTISKHEIQQQQLQLHAISNSTPATPAARTTATAIRTTNDMQLQFDTLNNNDITTVTASNDPVQSQIQTQAPIQIQVQPQAQAQAQTPTKGQKRRSLLNFKSFDFHIKSLYSGLRNSSGAAGGVGHKSESASQTQSRSSSLCGGAPVAARSPRVPPHLRIEGVDTDPDPEPDKGLLLDYSQSPYSPRRNSSTQLLPINNASLSPYYLSPYMATGAAGGGASSATGSENDCGNIRRSSTSDIVACRRRGSSSSTSNSRRPSTSDLLRRARERRGSEARMGRSVSHSAMRGMGSGGGCMGGRRTSMAF